MSDQMLVKAAAKSLRINPVEKDKKPDRHKDGTVRAVNSDGTYAVVLDEAPETPITCVPYCTAMVGDRVAVVLRSDGVYMALGRQGGDLGGGGTIVTQYDDASNYIAGRVFAYAGTDEPIGCLLCDGRAVSRTTYWELFAAIGTTYGAGDGSSTFNLPNIESRTIIGEGTGASGTEYALGATGGEEKHTLTVEELPENFPEQYIAFQGSGYTVDRLRLLYVDKDSAGWLSDNYSQNVNSGGGAAHNNMQPYIVMRYFITTGKGDPASGINPADYVVEWGKDEPSGFHYQKFASGWARIWRKDALEDTPYGTWNNEYAYTLTYGLPSWVISDVGTCVAGGMIGTGHATVSRSEIFYNGSGYEVQVLFLSSASEGTIYVSIECTVQWKDSPASGGTETIAPTIAERFEKLETDYIVAEGQSGIWNYRKWASGVAECWGEMQVSLASKDGPWGNGLYFKRADFDSFPFAFAATPNITVSGVASGYLFGVNVNSDSATGFDIFVWVDNNVTFYPWIKAQVIGRWK